MPNNREDPAMTEPTTGTNQPDDRALTNRLLATLGPVLDRVRDYVLAAEQNGQLRNELEAARAELAAARGEQANDVAEDTAELTKLAGAVDALRDLVWPAAEASPEVTPVAVIDDVPAVADGSLDPGDVTGRTDGSTEGSTGGAEQGDASAERPAE